MTLKRLRVESVRNIKFANLELGKGFNLFIGENGSGKTSLLESIHLLSAGRSFRNASKSSLINFQASNCTVYGEIADEGGIGKNTLGITRDRGDKRHVHINGQASQSATQLALLLPVVMLGPSSIELITGPPGQRRRFLNWGAFHVEPSFGRDWLSAQHSLKQRNALLRNKRLSASDLSSWTDQFALLSEKVTQHRRAYFKAFEIAFREAAEAILQTLTDLELRFHQGWADGEDLREVLNRERDREVRRGYTLFGHQRANLEICINGVNVNGVMSRGELKLIAWTLLIAQGLLLNKSSDKRALFLVDDLGAELDKHNCLMVYELLKQSGSQVCMTSLNADLLADLEVEDRKKEHLMVFHVEQGAFSDKGYKGDVR